MTTFMCDVPGCQSTCELPARTPNPITTLVSFGWNVVTVPDADTPQGPKRTIHLCPTHHDADLEKVVKVRVVG